MCESSARIMKLLHPTCKNRAFLLLAACLLPLSSDFALGQEVNKPIVSENPADREACRRQLSIIFSAIQEYRKRNQQFPRWLSDLMPDYLHDPDMLSCPFVRNSGNYKKWRKDFVSFPVFGDTLGTYAYEFCTAEIPGLPRATCRDHKKRLMELIGFGVPVVRCLAHRPTLNLAFDGTIYQSGAYWENIFVRTPSDEMVLHDVFFVTGASQNRAASKMVRPRDPEAGLRLLDLSQHYDATLLHLSQINYDGTLSECFPEGVRSIDGVDFDIRGLIHLTGQNFPIDFPSKVEDMAVNRKCAQIHFLHGTILAAPQESKIASYVVHYSDGGTIEVPIVYGKDVQTRWFDSRQKSQLENPRVAWASPHDKTSPGPTSLRLYHTAWNNSRPLVEVKSLSFVSHMTPSAPFLVAITLD